MVAGMLDIAGVYLGENADFSEGDAHNSKGYWEHARLHDLNDRLLAHLGGSHDRPPDLAYGWERDASLDPFYVEANSLIASVFGGRSLWAWKSPPVSLTIPFWQRVVPDLRFILCTRNPLDFASSVLAYQGMGGKHARALWLYHTINVLKNTRSSERFVCHFESFFPDYGETLSSLLDFIGTPCTLENPSVQARLASFHDSGMKHHSSSLTDLLSSNEVYYDVKETYLQLLAGPPDASEVPIVAQSELFMPLLQRMIVAETNILARYSDSVFQSIDGRESPSQTQAIIERKLREADRERRHLQSILNSRTHRIAAAICEMLIRLRSVRTGSKNPARDSFVYGTAHEPENAPMATNKERVAN